jgi:hypothetical protein
VSTEPGEVRLASRPRAEPAPIGRMMLPR